MKSPATRREHTFVATLCLALLLLGGCHPVQQAKGIAVHKDVPSDPIGNREVREGGTLTMGLSAEPDRLDPTTSTSLYTRYVMNSICEKLYDIDENSSIVPQLASALPKISDHGRTVSIPLKEGIKFSDGTEFDAAAVKKTLLRDLNKSDSARKSEMGPITSVEAPTDRRVELHYSKPFAPITAALADRAGMIMSPKALDKLGADFGDAPSCVGAFKFVERTPQTSITVKRDPNYYDAKDVHLDAIKYRIMTDANIRAANLRSGDVDVIDTVFPQDVDALLREDDIGILQSSSLGYQGVTFNLGNTSGVGKAPGKIKGPIANDPRIRQAFEHAIDRKALVNSVFNNWFEPACSPISPDSEFATAASKKCPKFDPDLSRHLLKQAGVKTPVTIPMMVTNTPDTLRFAQALQASVKDAGFDVKISPVEYTTLLDAQDRGDFKMLQLGWSGRVDPASNMSTFLTTGASLNVAGYSNSRVDHLLVKAEQETDSQKRARIYGKVISQAHKDDPIVYLYRQRNLTAYSHGVAGVATYPDGVVRVNKAAFLKEDD